MSTDPSEEETIQIIRRMAAGQQEAYGLLWDRHNKRMVRVAHHLLRRLGLDEADLDAEDAANYALFEISQAASRGKLDATENIEQFWSLYGTVLERTIYGSMDRQLTQKRGGSGLHQDRTNQGDHGPTEDGAPSTKQAFHRVDAELDELPSRYAAPEARVLAQLEYEALIKKRTDPLSSKILALKLQNYTKAEIAERLNLTMWTVAEKLRDIRRAYDRQQIGEEKDPVDEPREDPPPR
jgi:DNA-directed RNA polymerase specialized sigma24 family protein